MLYNRKLRLNYAPFLILAGALSTGASECGALNTDGLEDFNTSVRKVGDVSGLVRDGQSQDPVFGAQIRIADKSTTTDASGAFYLAGIHVGEQLIRVSGSDFKTISQAVMVSAGSNVINTLFVDTSSTGGDSQANGNQGSGTGGDTSVPVDPDPPFGPTDPQHPDTPVIDRESYDLRIYDERIHIRLGEIVRIADVTGDAVGDLVIASSAEKPEVFVFEGPINEEPLTLHDAHMHIDLRSDQGLASGRISLTTGDITGDGIQDIAIGRLFGFGGAFVNGRSNPLDFVVGNSTTGLGIYGMDSYTTQEAAPLIQDLNGDGHKDLIYSGYGPKAIYVVHGPVDLSQGGVSIPEDADLIIEGIAATPKAIAVGDTNGDRVPDLVVGEPWTNNGPATSAGKIWVFPGTLSGTHDHEAASSHLIESTLDGTTLGEWIHLVDLDGDKDAEILTKGYAFDVQSHQRHQDQSDAVYASTRPRDLITQTDWNGDGLDDAVFYQGVVFRNHERQLNLDVLDLKFDFPIPEQYWETTGRRMLSVGDLNNNNLIDLAVGMPSLSPDGWDQAGEVRIFFDVNRPQ